MKKKFAYSFLIMLFILCWSGCKSPSVVYPPEPTDTSYCEVGCNHLNSLVGRDGKSGCEESRDLEMQSGEIVTCKTFCIDTQEHGRSIGPKCWLTVNKCSDIEDQCRR